MKCDINITSGLLSYPTTEIIYFLPSTTPIVSNKYSALKL